MTNLGNQFAVHQTIIVPTETWVTQAARWVLDPFLYIRFYQQKSLGTQAWRVLNQFCMSCQSYLRLWKASTRHQTAMGLGFKQNEGGKKRSTSQLVNLPILLPTLYLSHLCNLKKSFKWRQQSISRRTSNTVQATVRTLNTKLQKGKKNLLHLKISDLLMQFLFACSHHLCVPTTSPLKLKIKFAAIMASSISVKNTPENLPYISNCCTNPWWHTLVLAKTKP